MQQKHLKPPSNAARGSGGGGEGDSMRTVECLRGRLLAERVASKAAKEEADLLAKRLDELEKKLSDEIKIRNKAEKKLRKAIKKLESLKILNVELSDSSIGSLSSNCFSGYQEMELEERKPGSLSSGDYVQSGPVGEAKGSEEDGDSDSARGSSAGSCTQVNSKDGSWCSVLSEQYQSDHCKQHGICMDLEDTKNCRFGVGVGDHDSDRTRQQLVAANGSTKSEDYCDEDENRLALVLVDPQHSVAEDDSKMEDNVQEARFEDQPDEEEDKLALVLVDIHHTTKADDSKMEDNVQTARFEEQPDEENKFAIVLVDPQPDTAAERRKINSNAQAVLLALQQVKEQLRYTIERRSELFAQNELYGH